MTAPASTAIGRRILALVPVALGAAMLWRQHDVRIAEAQLQRWILTGLGVDAHRVGTTVIFPMSGRFYGVALSLGCSVGPVLSVFLAATGIALWFRTLSLRSLTLAVAAIVSLFVLVNEVRIAVIVGAMHRWGFRTGYDVSHVFVGSAISTVGFVIAVLLFVKLVLRRGRGVPA